MKEKYLHTYYNPDWVYKNIRLKFSLHEFFSKKMISRYSEDQLWSFLDFRLLSNLLFIRLHHKLPITINTWKSGGALSQRGFRSILSKIVLGYAMKGKMYASAHTRGAAIDFNEKGLTAEETRQWIDDNSYELPYKCRLEWMKGGKPISWVHLDVDYYPNHRKVYRFNV